MFLVTRSPTYGKIANKQNCSRIRPDDGQNYFFFFCIHTCSAPTRCVPLRRGFPQGPRRKNLAGWFFKKIFPGGPYESSAAAARGGEAWQSKVWCPVYIRPSLQFSLTLTCTKALSKTLPNIHGLSHVPAPPRAPADVVDRNLVRSPREDFFWNHPAKFFLWGPWGKPLLRGTQRASTAGKSKDGDTVIRTSPKIHFPPQNSGWSCSSLDLIAYSLSGEVQPENRTNSAFTTCAEGAERGRRVFCANFGAIFGRKKKPFFLGFRRPNLITALSGW